MILHFILAALAALSLALTLWQWLVARRFPLHRRMVLPADVAQPGVTLLKPLKGCDAATEACLRSWLVQHYRGSLQALFGVAAADDPVCAVVRKLLGEFPEIAAELVICGPPAGTNAKVSQLVELERRAKHEVVIISDADVQAPADLLGDLVATLADPACGLACVFYRLANPATLAMQWEAVAVNADFWSQVLQSRSLKPIDFALGAVMATRRRQLGEIGGFAGLIDCLADDYQLGNRIAQRGYAIALSPVVVECRTSPMSWSEVWKHQLRWARTIRVCQPVPYFFSILSNATLWPLVWLLAQPVASVAVCAGVCWLVRILTALDLQRRLNRVPREASVEAREQREKWAREDARPRGVVWLVPVKDILQAALWLLAFLGNRIEWRGERMQLRRDGSLAREQ